MPRVHEQCHPLTSVRARQQRAVPQWRRPGECQPAELVAVREVGLMWANMLRAFQVGKFLTSVGSP
jgi:hypothetical protein